jgi:urocanate hydratase
MNLNTYECWVKVPISSTSTQSTKVHVQAMNALAARGQLNAQYGFNNVISLPIQVRA